MRFGDHFWIVWRRYHRHPNFIHETLESATAEAERLSKEYPMGAFFVLEVVQKVGPGTEPPPQKTPRKERVPQNVNSPLTPEQQAARHERKLKKREEWESKHSAKTEDKKPLTLAEIRRQKEKKD